MSSVYRSGCTADTRPVGEAETMAGTLEYRESPEYGEDVAEVSVSSIVAVVSELTGTAGTLEHTGGNCAAVVFPLEGAVLAVVDGDVFTYSAGEWQGWYEGWAACVYPVDADGCWADEPSAMASGEGADTDTLREVVRDALAGGHESIPGQPRGAYEPHQSGCPFGDGTGDVCGCEVAR